MKLLFDYKELVNLSHPAERPLRRDKAPIAVAAVLLVMGLAALEVLPIAALALIAATAVVALRCLDPEEAYGAIRWNILMLIFGMLAVGIAMDKTRSEEHTSELQSLMRISYAVFCLKKKNKTTTTT